MGLMTVVVSEIKVDFSMVIDVPVAERIHWPTSVKKICQHPRFFCLCNNKKSYMIVAAAAAA